jgi:hypothetical protein
VQVDPIKPTVKAPGSKRLKLNNENLLSNELSLQLAPVHLGRGGGAAAVRALVAVLPHIYC